MVITINGLKKLKVGFISSLLGEAVPDNKDQKVQPISFIPDYFVLVLRAVLQKKPNKQKKLQTLIFTSWFFFPPPGLFLIQNKKQLTNWGLRSN